MSMSNQEILLETFKRNGLTLGSVESLTAGLFASTFCETPGASEVFKGGIVTYSNEEKINLVGVKEETIASHGVVSKEVAVEMAEGGVKALNVDVAVSFTGNAGPGTEIGEATVGEVYMAIATKKTPAVVYHKIFDGSRNEIRAECVSYMNELLLWIFGNSR